MQVNAFTAPLRLWGGSSNILQRYSDNVYLRLPQIPIAHALLSRVAMCAATVLAALACVEHATKLIGATPLYLIGRLLVITHLCSPRMGDKFPRWLDCAIHARMAFMMALSIPICVLGLMFPDAAKKTLGLATKMPARTVSIEYIRTAIERNIDTASLQQLLAAADAPYATARDAAGNTLLHTACACRNVAAIGVLMRHVNFTLVNHAGQTPEEVLRSMPYPEGLKAFWQQLPQLPSAQEWMKGLSDHQRLETYGFLSLPGERASPEDEKALNAVYGTTPLHLALEFGNPEKIATYAQNLDYLGVVDHKGQSALTLACMKLNSEVVKAVLDSLHHEARNSSAPLLALTLKAWSNDPGRGEEALIIINRLRAAGAHLANKEGELVRIPANLAAHSGIWKELLCALYQIKPEQLPTRPTMEAALQAFLKGHDAKWGELEFLLSTGRKAEAQRVFAQKPALERLESYAILCAPDRCGPSMQITLNALYGSTPIALAKECCAKQRQVDHELLLPVLAKLVAMEFVPPNTIVAGTKGTLFHYAASWGYLPLMEEIVKLKVDVNIKNEAAQTPLMFLCRSPQVTPKSLTFLLENGASGVLGDNQSFTAIGYAISANLNLEMMELFAQYRLGWCARGTDGLTPWGRSLGMLKTYWHWVGKYCACGDLISPDVFPQWQELVRRHGYQAGMEEALVEWSSSIGEFPPGALLEIAMIFGVDAIIRKELRNLSLQQFFTITAPLEHQYDFEEMAIVYDTYFAIDSSHYTQNIEGADTGRVYTSTEQKELLDALEAEIQHQQQRPLRPRGQYNRAPSLDPDELANLNGMIQMIRSGGYLWGVGSLASPEDWKRTNYGRLFDACVHFKVGLRGEGDDDVKLSFLRCFAEGRAAGAGRLCVTGWEELLRNIETMMSMSGAVVRKRPVRTILIDILRAMRLSIINTRLPAGGCVHEALAFRNLFREDLGLGGVTEVDPLVRRKHDKKSNLAKFYTFYKPSILIEDLRSRMEAMQLRDSRRELSAEPLDLQSADVQALFDGEFSSKWEQAHYQSILDTIKRLAAEPTPMLLKAYLAEEKIPWKWEADTWLRTEEERLNWFRQKHQAQRDQIQELQQLSKVGAPKPTKEQMKQRLQATQRLKALQPEVLDQLAVRIEGDDAQDRSKALEEAVSLFTTSPGAVEAEVVRTQQAACWEAMTGRQGYTRGAAIMLLMSVNALKKAES